MPARGQVVKVNAGILGKNLLRVRDGFGSAVDGTLEAPMCWQEIEGDW